MLAVIASRYDKNGIDIHFLNNDSTGEHLKVKRFTVQFCRFWTDNGFLTQLDFSD